MKELKEQLGTRIRECRGYYGFSQESLAAEAGVSRAYINQLENGRSKAPSVWTMYAIAKAFGIDVEVLINPNHD